MIKALQQKSTFSKELIFQIILHILVFIFYAFGKGELAIQNYQYLFFLNYAIAALFINYLLLPRFFYKKKYWAFGFSFLILTIIMIFMEEMVLEKVYFPDQEVKRFSFSILYWQ